VFGCRKPLKGFGGAGVLEIVDDFEGDTFQAIYTVRFAKIIYVLHAFQKNLSVGAPLLRLNWT
jgi:phage-related protein